MQMAKKIFAELDMNEITMNLGGQGTGGQHKSRRILQPDSLEMSSGSHSTERNKLNAKRTIQNFNEHINISEKRAWHHINGKEMYKSTC